MMSETRTLYERAGGDAPFRRMVDHFYAAIEQDPLLRPMFPDDLEAGKQRQFLFITQYFGGPARYSAERGHPRLRMRHMPFPIGQAERNAWVGHMLAAIDGAGFPEELRPALREYFERAATFLINSADRAPEGRIEIQG